MELPYRRTVRNRKIALLFIARYLLITSFSKTFDVQFKNISGSAWITMGDLLSFENENVKYQINE